MAATLNDVAERAGVSVSTVSRVLSNQGEKYRIRQETEDRILTAAKELKYRANHLARGLRLSKTNTIGVLAPDISNPFFAHIIKRIQSAAHELGYSIVVCNTDESLDLEVEQVNLLYRKRVDGLIAMPVGLHYEHFSDWMEKGLGLVLLDRCFDSLDASSVTVDNYKGAFEAVTYLADQGHERIAMIQGLQGTYTNTARIRGFRDALDKRGIEIDERLIVGGDFRRENGYVETKLLLNLPDPPTAIFGMSDLITLGVLEALAEEGLRIPEDLSLISFDDFDFAPFLRSPLTVVRQPKEMMGELAVKLLVDHIVGTQREPRRVMLQPKLLIRASVSAPTAPETAV
ncbi:LacI family DNA-binding transcriptional regulator [soil metagenome]